MIKTMTQAEYSRHRNISPARVSTMISTGKIPPSCFEMKNDRRQIDVVMADQALSENLDKIRNPHRGPEPAQLKAHAWAWEGDCERREMIWLTLRYLVKLQELSPEAIKVVLPDPEDEGIIFEYKSYDLDCGICQERLYLDILLDEE